MAPLGFDELIARDSERTAAITEVTAGRGAAIVGAVGVGKTALAAAVTGALNPRRFAVEWTTATRASRNVPFGVFARLFARWDRVDPALVHAKVAGELAERASGRTPVLVVDDAHRLDDASAGVVLGLAESGRVRVVVTAVPDAWMPDAVVALWKQRLLRRLDVIPFDQAATASLIRSRLGGDVAEPTVARLFEWTAGNQLLLTELLRHGKENGRLVCEGGLWWWRGDLSVPVALVDADFDQLGAPARDAVAAVALGGPLPVAAVDSVAPGVVEELTENGPLRTFERGDDVLVGFASPLVEASVRASMSPARRLRLASALLAGAADSDVVRLCRFAPEVANPRLLLRASRAVRATDPELAVRFARRAPASVAATVALAEALVEAGDCDEAKRVLDSAPQRLPVVMTKARIRCWVDRDPLGAREDLLGLGYVDPVVDLAVWHAHPVLTGRTEAVGTTGSPLDQAAAGLARLWRAPDAVLPTTDAVVGRWPGDGPVEWALLAGYAHLLRGEYASAVRRLREAVVAQSGGWRLFETEAKALLAVSLADAGRADEADLSFDDVSLVPGISQWARAVVNGTDMGLALDAARAAGCWAVELSYLQRCPEQGERIAEVARHVDADRLTAIVPEGAARDQVLRLDRLGLKPFALRVAEQGGERMLAARLRGELGLPCATGGLTRRESEIAALAAGGLSDRAIADRLGISVRTVETHLIRVYRKLGVNSRRDLQVVV